MKEAAAIELCLAHQDPVGFEFLVKKYRREAYYHAMSLLGNPEDAADACQESFTRAFAAITKLTALDCFYPWFYRILRNCCLNMLSRRKTVEKNKESAETGCENDAPAVSPEVLLEKNEEHLLIWEILHQLPAAAREILVLKYTGGHNYEEISEILGIPRGTVMSRLYHARKGFREKYLERTGAQ